MTKISKPNVPSKHMRLGDYNGYPVYVKSVGIGASREYGGLNSYGEGETWEEYDEYKEVLLPCLNGDKIKAAGLTKEAEKAMHDKDIREVLNSKWEPYFLKWGINDFGYVVERIQ